MKIQFRYVTIEVDDRLRERLADAGERLRLNVMGYLRSATDDLESAGERLRTKCDTAAARVNAAMSAANYRIAPSESDRELNAETRESLG